MTTTPTPRIAVLVGSLRRASLNRAYADALGRLAADRLDFRVSEIGDLPLYNDDLWAEPPEAVLRLKSEVAAADGVLLVTPEYNRGTTPALKNALDWGSRPKGRSVWLEKPAAVTGISPGTLGTLAGQVALRGLGTAVGMLLMTQPETYMVHRDGLIADGEIADPATREFLSGWADAFARFVARHG